MKKASTLVCLFLFVNQFNVFAQLPTPSSGRIVRIENFSSMHVPARNVDVWLPDNYTPTKNMRYYICTMGKCFLTAV